jgi:membrane protein YqaA with SNARE-associated domain
MLVLAGATWLFLRSSSFRGRTLSIAAGSTIGLTLGHICNSTWDWQTYYGRPHETTTWTTALWRTGLFLVLLGVFLFWPSVIGLLRRVALRRTT